MQTSKIFVVKNLKFFVNYQISARTRWERNEAVRMFCGQEVNFSDFVWTSFMDGPLIVVLSY